MAENTTSNRNSPPPPIEVRDLTMAYGERVIVRDMNFVVPAGEIFIVMGGSGCGKSTLLRHLIGLMAPAKGRVFRDGVDFWALSGAEQDRMKRRSGILFQGGALWSAMTLAENIEDLPDLKEGQKIISPISQPLKKTGHLQILYGNLAEEGAVGAQRLEQVGAFLGESGGRRGHATTIAGQPDRFGPKATGCPAASWPHAASISVPRF